MGNPISIALASDGNYLDGLVGTLCSILRRNRATDIQATILDCGIDDHRWTTFEKFVADLYPDLSLTRAKIPPQRLDIFQTSPRERRVTKCAYARLLLPEILPTLDRVLYLDCDLYVDTDLRPLFFSPLGKSPVAAVSNYDNPRLEDQLHNCEILLNEERHLSSFNSGVLLLNLDMIRRTDLLSEFVAQSKRLDGVYSDQSLLNYVLRGQWKALPDKWNRQIRISDQFTFYRSQPNSIWHFIGPRKPWHFDPNFSRGVVADFHRYHVYCKWPQAVSFGLKPLGALAGLGQKYMVFLPASVS